MTVSKQGIIHRMWILWMAGVLAIVVTLLIFMVFPTGCAVSGLHGTAANMQEMQAALSPGDATGDSGSSGFVAEDTSTVTVNIKDNAAEEGA